MADWYASSAAWTAISQFVASHAYSVGDILRPLTAPAFNAQYTFRCTTAGTSAAEPSWASAAGDGATVTSGGATFTNVAGRSAYGWSAAAGNIYCLTGNGSAGVSRFVVGDRAFLSSDHSESTTATTYTLANSAGFGVISVVSVNRAGSVPPAAADALSGANITVTTGAWYLDAYSNEYWQGVTFTVGGSSTGVNFGNANSKTHYLKNCAFVFTTSNTAAAIANGIGTKAVFDNTTVTFNAANQRLFLTSGYPTDFAWINTPSAVSGTVPTVLFSSISANGAQIATCRGVDLSAVTTTLCYSANNYAFAKALFDSCRIAPGVVRLGTTSYYNTIDEIELVNCYDGTHIIAERHTPAGDLTTEFATTMVGGATDNVGLFSHKMVSSVRCDQWAMTLDSFWLDINDTTTGSSHTATVELIASSALNNNDVRLILEYQGTTGSSLATFGDSLASVLTATAALPTSSTPIWNSPPATPVKQHLSVTFTAQTAGRLRGLVRLGKASTTLWINPQIVVT